MSTQVREPAVAGMFYPSEPEALSAQVQQFVTQARSRVSATPKAIIGPHAGYRFSGAVAGEAYSALSDIAPQISRVVLLGPSHRVPFRGMAACSADYFSTPLGSIPVDRQALDSVLTRDDVFVLDDAHALEHGLEVHLPFLQQCLGEFRLIPLVVGDSTPEAVGTLLEQLWGRPETLVVISSDLSHFMDYDSATARDTATSRAIEQLRYEAVMEGDACGRHPINGLLWLARRRGLKGEILDLRNSGDTAGHRDSVVGYGAYAFHG